MNHLENMLVTPTAVVGVRVRRHTLMAFTGSIPPILLINQTNNSRSNNEGSIINHLMQTNNGLNGICA
jgi:hypothetical protein